MIPAVWFSFGIETILITQILIYIEVIVIYGLSKCWDKISDHCKILIL